ncbi:MAG: HsdR family type I site-specific deoxyribonuclease [Nitrospirae bacterium]|nr:MAG: HsdR family type I site-specific deoxyribonuclease [Nitrospirota bacterium]
MTLVNQRESDTQRRVIDFFHDALGYEYLGNWKDRAGNANIEKDWLRRWLESQGHSERIIGQALRQLEQAAAITGSKSLYDANRAVYSLLRYGVRVRPDLGEQHQTVWLIDWDHPENNHFAVAEEVTVAGMHTKRPDVVLYVNGIALGVLELKRSSVSVTEGIRQNLTNQKKEFIQPFFATVQLIMAGNETEGLRYAVIGTPEKYWLRWKEADAHPLAGDNPLLRELGQLCRKERLLELIHDFIVFDAGTKKICRHNQYFGVKAAQEFIRRREGGIIWHTQGSGKSLTMVWLARWIRENIPNARVLIVTDRIELDEQIEKVFKGVDEDIRRTRSGADLVRVLQSPEEWLVCSLIHKFGCGEDLSERDIETYVEEIRKSLPEDFRPAGELFVFVDECHRTQSGKLHRAMKTLLPGATFIGFTGTPLLKRDKPTSVEIFGPYIHTYKYDEAVRDGVVLDLQYEARDIDQRLMSEEKVDQWFEAKTRGLSEYAKAQVKRRWGTMKQVLSAQDRLRKIVADILLDMETRPRLASGHGNAILVTDSIYNACRIYEMFQETPLKGKCAVVTSYRPSPDDIKGEETGEGLTERMLQYNTYRRMLAEWFDEPEETAMYKVEEFEKQVKKRFVEEPGRMKLLIVVDKLLTGFDAPPATYLYIDKPMRDHGLFQAICRVNRLHTEDKEYGYIVDYRDLFKSLAKSIKDYTGEAFDGYDREDVDGLLKDRLQKGRERLEELREKVKALCEPVEPSEDTAAYLRYFCAAESGNAEQLKANEPKRVQFYKLVSSLLRAYAAIANEMPDAGYSVDEITQIRKEVRHYAAVRDEVRLASGDYVDMKMFEPAMRHLLDTYIHAEDSKTIASFDDMPLVDLIVERGVEALGKLPAGLRTNPEAMAETIENNVRRLIIDKMAVNPAYYEKMSRLLDALIEERRRQALEYKDYLKRIQGLVKKIKQPESSGDYPAKIDTPALQALYDNLKDILPQQVEEVQEPYGDGAPVEMRVAIACRLDDAIRAVLQDGWRGNRFKERLVRQAIRKELAPYSVNEEAIDRILEIVRNQREY